MKCSIAIKSAVGTLLLITASAGTAATPDVYVAPPSSAVTWYESGRRTVISARRLQENLRRAKNVILFVGDGMGVSTVTAARILDGQQPRIIKASRRTPSSGEENQLYFERLPYLAHSKTYSVNQQTPDSAPTMTAMVTGVKTNDGELSVDETVARADCAVDLATHSLTTILELAEDAGKSTGVVSTARLTHATPGANYAHTPERDWESDADQPAGCAVRDIARQLIEFDHGRARAKGLEVALGGGRDRFLPREKADPEYPSKTGKRKDARDLTQEWLTQYSSSAYVWNKQAFDQVDPATTNHLLGLFEPSHMQYEVDRNRTRTGEPSLAEMTEKALKILGRNQRGFYLHVEGGRVDHGHHAGNAYRALTDTIALSDAVQRAVQVLGAAGQLEDTLIVVTADHSHVFTIAGYPQRGNNILGKVISPGAEGFSLAADGKPYTTLSYANGAGFAEHVPADGAGYTPNPGREDDMTLVDTTDKDFHQQSLVPFSMGGETHAGEDVAIYASGPMAHLVHGTLEQNVIFHVMKVASGL